MKNDATETLPMMITPSGTAGIGVRHDSTTPARPGRIPAAARALLASLARIEHGTLVLEMPGGERQTFGNGEPRVTLRLANWNMFSATLRSGDVGFAESYLDGDWSTDSLVALLELALVNRNRLESAIYGSVWGRLALRLRHFLNRNTKAGSRRNIQAHYDLGNEFYRLWLDPSMTYSSALFDARPAVGAGSAIGAGPAAGSGPAESEGVVAGSTDDLALEQAQQAKYRRILDELGLGPGASVLEIGCGWGGFAEIAARDGLQVRGLTLSHEQLAYARKRIARAGLQQRAQFELCDYRDETGRYDGIASIEMFEAVGERYWPGYFAALARALAPGGRAVVQTITIADNLFERYRRSSDFIQQYVFPGGMLPSVQVFEEQARRAGLQVVKRLEFGQDYATTLALWRERFLARIDEVRALGFDTRFERIWEFYLAYCEAAFRHRNTDVLQFTLEHASQP